MRWSLLLGMAVVLNEDEKGKNMGKTLIQMYQLVLLEFLITNEETSVCKVAKTHLSEGDFKVFNAHFQRQKPCKKKHMAFMSDLLPQGDLWWPLDTNGRVKRRKFMEYMIKQLEDAKINRIV